MPLWVVAGTMQHSNNYHVVTGCYVAATENEVVGLHMKNMMDEKPQWKVSGIKAYKVDDAMIMIAAKEILTEAELMEGR